MCPPHDNNVDNLETLADWKRAAVRDWVRTGVPVILDVSNGFDGRIVWAENGTGSGVTTSITLTTVGATG